MYLYIFFFKKKKAFFHGGGGRSGSVRIYSLRAGRGSEKNVYIYIYIRPRTPCVARVVPSPQSPSRQSTRSNEQFEPPKSRPLRYIYTARA